jgi:uncharacterized protein
MKIIPPSAFVTMTWKNGGGITHEILKEERGGKLLWRLSIAEVASDGPFSLFPSLSRILTVIDGAGLELTAPGRVIKALPLRPVSFSGDWPIASKRIAGNVRDFNVIFDAAAVSASVAVHDGLKAASPTQFILALEDGSANGQSISAHSLVLPDGLVSITGRCLQVIVQER